MRKIFLNWIFLKCYRTTVCAYRCNSEMFSLVRESNILNADVKGYLWRFSSLSFVSLQSLLDEPNPNSPANSQAAQLYQENKREYEKRVTAIVEQSWVDVWAPQTLCYFLSIALPSPSSHFIGRSFLPHRDKEEKKKSNSIRRTQVPPWKKRKNETTKPQWTYTCLPIHLRKTRGGEINLMFVFLFFFF